jgi:hypothetical protein
LQADEIYVKKVRRQSKIMEVSMKNKHHSNVLIFFFWIFMILLSVSGALYAQSPGDVDNNGSITIVDALVIAQYYVGMTPATFYVSAADVNADGTINIVDALLVAQYYVGIITEFPGSGSATNPPAVTPNPTAPSSETPDPTSSTNPPGGGDCGLCEGPYGTYPYCCDPETSDPDGDGWGWENGQSCIVKGSQVEYDMDCVCPAELVCPGEAKCSCYQVPGLGENKKTLTAARGTVYDIAAAMMETEKMDTNYPFGDGKQGDAAWFGLCKQNWGMLRQVNPDWRNLGPGDYETGGALNNNRELDIRLLHASQDYFGDLWWAGHRNGSTGLANPDTEDIRNFRKVMDWTYEQLNRDPMYLTNDVRFGVDVPAI